MTVSRSMQRLLRVREIEEDRSRTVLESALAELRRLESALQSANERERRGRKLIAASAGTGEVIDRLSGLEETRAAARQSMAITPRISEAAASVETSRQKFLGRRIERRQVEMLLDQEEKREAAEAARRAQQELDHWFLDSLHRVQQADAQMQQPAADAALLYRKPLTELES